MEYHYSKQLVQEIADQLDPVLVKFFLKTSSKYNFRANTIVELVNDSMESILGGRQSKDELTALARKVRNNRLKMRRDWYNKLVKEVAETDMDSPDYPFHQIVVAHNALDEEQWEGLYGEARLEDVIASKMEEAHKWANSSESYLTAFGLILSKKSFSVYKALLSDVFIDLYNYLMDNYAGSIKNYFQSVPKEMAKLPIFGLNTGKMKLEDRDEEGNYIQDYDFGEKKSLRIVYLNADTPVLAMGPMDLRIITECIKHVEADFYRTRTIRVKRSALVKTLYPNIRASSDCYRRMEERCLNLSYYNCKVYDREKEVGRINLMDTVDVHDPEIITFIFGSMLYNNVINNELTNIKTRTLKLLKDPMSELLCQMLCEERIMLSSMGSLKDIGPVGTYNYSFFRSVVRLSVREKRNNIARIKKSLQEYVDNKIIVESFVMRGTETFEIHFYPLTDEEWADIEYNKKYREEVVDGTLIEEIV